VRFGWLLPAPLLAACGLSVVGTASSDGGTDLPDRDAAMGADRDAAPPTNIDGASDDAKPACDPAACPGKRCVNDACSFFTDCKDLRDNSPPGVTSGTYTFARGDAGTFPAYCEMALANGGWTLVGQTASGPGASTNTSFGWRAATGSLNDLTKPYSLDALGKGLTPTQVLLAKGMRSAITAAYVVQVPVGFPAGYDSSAANTTGTTKVQNATCPNADSDQPSMLNYMGRTALTNKFFFRDMTPDFPSGLFPDRWELAYMDCPNGGGYQLTQGMLFAR
jgi:hypothetical protein